MSQAKPDQVVDGLFIVCSGSYTSITSKECRL